MADVTLFVDDAVRGAGPDVCVKTGVPATIRMSFQTTVQERSFLALLLVGPLGWLLSGSPETLTVRLPMSGAAVAGLDRRRWERRIAVALLVIGLVLLVVVAQALHADLGASALVVVLVAGAGVIVTGWRLGAAGVGLDLDASRRWVTVSGVHPDFAAAVAAATVATGGPGDHG